MNNYLMLCGPGQRPLPLCDTRRVTTPEKSPLLAKLSPGCYNSYYGIDAVDVMPGRDGSRIRNGAHVQCLRPTRSQQRSGNPRPIPKGQGSLHRQLNRQQKKSRSRQTCQPGPTYGPGGLCVSTRPTGSYGSGDSATSPPLPGLGRGSHTRSRTWP